jgi:hypothetical protein
MLQISLSRQYRTWISAEESDAPDMESTTYAPSPIRTSRAREVEDSTEMSVPAGTWIRESALTLL